MRYGPNRSSVGLLVLLMAAAGFSSGCSALRALDIENPTYVLRRVRPDISLAIPVSQSSIDFHFDVEVRNPNAIGLNLDRVAFDLLVNRTKVMTGTTTQNVAIPARGNGNLSFTTRLGYSEARTLFGELVDWLRGERPRYEMRGTAWYRTGLGSVSFPFEMEWRGN